MCSFRQTVKTDMNSTTLEMARTSADTFAETIVGAVTAASPDISLLHPDRFFSPLHFMTLLRPLM